MEVFNDPKYLFLHDKYLNFNWIEIMGRTIEVLADDLVELAEKNGMNNHELPTKIDNELKELRD